jgi:nitrogen fixation/metabolism regulation signal transduction histidine kinase
MVYKRLYIQVIIRVAFLLSTCIVLSRIIFSREYLHASIVVSGLLIFEIFELIWYLNRTNRKLAQFFISLQDRASSAKFDGIESRGSFRDLGLRLEEIYRLIQTERREKEAQNNYLNFLVENIGVGIIIFQDNGIVDLINPAAKEILANKNIQDLSLLNKYNPEFESVVYDLDLNKSALLRIIVKDELFYLTLQKSLFKIEDQSFWLVSFQDINSELDKKELDAWQKVIRVLTHEIMSSISPVSSLSDHLLKKINDPKKPGISMEPEVIGDIAEGLEIIKSRGEGLMDFVKHYQSFTHPPLPKTEKIQVYPFLQNILRLIKPECEENKVSISLDVEESMELSFDPQLIEQLIINLIRNSIQAFEGIDKQREIQIIACFSGYSAPQISVKDYGCGIDTDNMDNIFIPFYTTREKGSGIGLSFARQIMRLHGGQISVKSEVNNGAEFTLRF